MSPGVLSSAPPRCTYPSAFQKPKRGGWKRGTTKKNKRKGKRKKKQVNGPAPPWKGQRTSLQGRVRGKKKEPNHGKMGEGTNRAEPLEKHAAPPPGAVSRKSISLQRGGQRADWKGRGRGRRSFSHSKRQGRNPMEQKSGNKSQDPTTVPEGKEEKPQRKERARKENRTPLSKEDRGNNLWQEERCIGSPAWKKAGDGGRST